jgi:hypothetical protein
MRESSSREAKRRSGMCVLFVAWGGGVGVPEARVERLKAKVVKMLR